MTQSADNANTDNANTYYNQQIAPLVLPACIIQGDDVVALNSALMQIVGEQVVPVALDALMDTITRDILQQHLRHMHPEKNPQGIVKLALKRPNRNEWACIANLQYLADEPADAPAYLVLFQEDYVGESYQILQHYLQETSDFIMIADIENNFIIYANQLSFVGYDWHDIVSSQWLLDQIHPDDYQRVRVFREQINRLHHRQTNIDYRLRLPQIHSITDEEQIIDDVQDGHQYIWIESRETALEVNDEGDCLRLIYHLSIVTERKRFERALSERNRALTAMQEISRAVNQSTNLETTLDELFDQVQFLIPFTSASIFVVEGDWMSLIGHKNLPEDVVQSLRTDIVTIDTLARHTIERRKPHIVPDTYLEPDWYELPSTNYIRCWMGVPLTRNDEVIGMINFDHEKPNFYNESHYGYATTIAAHVALTIYKNRLYENLQKELKERQRAEETLLTALARTEAMYQSGYLMMRSEQLQDSLPDILNLILLAIEAEQVLLVTFDLTNQTPQFVEAVPELPEDRIWMHFQQIATGKATATKIMPSEDLPFRDGTTLALPDGRYAALSSVNRRGALIALRTSAPFDVYDTDLLVALASPLTVTIERDELTTRLQAYTNRLEVSIARATSTLQLERQRLQAILDATGEGMVYMEDNTIQYANPAFCRMLGYDEDDIVGKRLNAFYAPSNRKNMLYFDNNDTQPTSRYDQTLKCANDKDIYAQLTFSLIGRLGEKPTRLVAVVRDISEERALHEQRMRFIANAAHELRTPLTSLHLRLHMLRRQPHRIDEHLTNLEKVYDYLKLLVEELLDLSRFEKGTVTLEYQKVDLCELIDKAIDKAQEHAQQANVKLVKRCVCPLYAEVDRERLQQLLTILLTNGINYSEANDEVSLSLTPPSVVEGAIPLYAELIVQDTGIGIPADLTPEEIFMPFSRARLGSRRETGMGLAIAREIVNLHGGQITVESQPQQGSRFRILLPLIASQSS
jgi:PAS domain S-box-containing protein